MSNEKLDEVNYLFIKILIQVIFYLMILLNKYLNKHTKNKINILINICLDDNGDVVFVKFHRIFTMGHSRISYFESIKLTNCKVVYIEFRLC